MSSEANYAFHANANSTDTHRLPPHEGLLLSTELLYSPPC